MHLGAEAEPAGITAGEAPARASDRPAGDHLREAGDVELGIAATHSEGVQLEDLARKILVDTYLARHPAALCPARKFRVRPHRLLVIQIQEHRRMGLDAKQQVVEVAEHVRADRLALETPG